MKFMHLRFLAVLLATAFLTLQAIAASPSVELLCANPPCNPDSFGTAGGDTKNPMRVTDLHGPEDARRGDKVILNFQGADIASVAKVVGLVTHHNFVIDPRVSGVVNIISSEPVARDLVYPIFLSTLRLQGFSTIESGGFTKILPEADAKLSENPVLTGPSKVTGDRIITQVIPLQYENAAQLLPVLRPLIAPNNVINAYPNNNTLVITDYASNMARLLKVIAEIDVPPSGDVQIMKLEFASALDIASMIGKLMPEVTQLGSGTGQNQQSAKTTMTVDPRTNSLLVRSENTATLGRIRKLIEKLDTPAAGVGNIHVIYLKNAEALKVAEALRGIMTGDSGRSSGSSSANNPFAGGAAGSMGSANSSPSTPPGNGGTTGLSSGVSTIQNFNSQGPPTVSFSLPPSQGGGVVEAYPATNSLVVVAPDNVYNNLRAVVEKLDTRRAQVFVEALIVEVSQTKADSFGVQWQALSGLNGTNQNVIGGTNFNTSNGTNIISAAGNITGVTQGLNVGVVKGKVTLPNGTVITNLGALVQAMQTDSSVNVLSTPNILTIDNEEAKIVVGQNVPFLTGSQTSTSSGLTNPFQTYERHDVGITLRVKPTISEGGSVKLSIYQEVSSVDNTTTSQLASLGGGVVTKKRTIESVVLVDDGQIIVLGGLISDEVDGSSGKVPLLGDIPFIGYLFRSDSRTHAKTNLMVFMRPVILRDATAPASLTGDRYEFMRDTQINLQLPDHPILAPMEGPVLKPIDSAPGKK
jgi:general secretion pathway protein D